MTRLPGLAFIGLVAVLALVPAAAASYSLTTGATSASVRVDQGGSAGVTWRANGKTTGFVVPTSGQGYHGTVATDVSKRDSLALPMAIAVRRAPNGTFYALQVFKVGSLPVSLDVSRWHGAPTAVTLAVAGDHLIGAVTFDRQAGERLEPDARGPPLPDLRLPRVPRVPGLRDCLAADARCLPEARRHVSRLPAPELGRQQVSRDACRGRTSTASSPPMPGR